MRARSIGFLLPCSAGLQAYDRQRRHGKRESGVTATIWLPSRECTVWNDPVATERPA